MNFSKTLIATVLMSVISMSYGADAVKNSEQKTATDKQAQTAAVNNSADKIKNNANTMPQKKVQYVRPDANQQTKDAAQKIANEGKLPSIPADFLRGKGQTKEATEKLAQVAQVKAAPVEKVKVINDSTIMMKPGENVYIPISKDHPNRIRTPFKNPQIISTTLRGGKVKGECGEACVRDGIVYITTESSQAVTAFITDKENEDIAFSVTMIPRPIPPREVTFTFPKETMEALLTKKGKSSVQQAESWETSHPYVETLRQTLRTIAREEIPAGYSLRKVKPTDPYPRCEHPGLSIDFVNGQLAEGFKLDIYVGVAKNVSKTPVEFREQACGGWRIAAVTSWPLKVLEPGQETEVYIVTKKQEEIQQDHVRRSLITKELN